jgi:hypothetical protein
MYYIKFNEDGYQEQAKWSETAIAEPDWYEVSDNIDGKLFQISSDGQVSEMSDEEKKSYNFSTYRVEVLKSLRYERNQRLVQSDWTEISSLNSSLSDEKIAEWQSYRQVLRNLPESLDEDLNFEWPAIPQ